MDLNKLNNFIKFLFIWEMLVNSFKFIKILYFKIIILVFKINILIFNVIFRFFK